MPPPGELGTSTVAFANDNAALADASSVALAGTFAAAFADCVSAVTLTNVAATLAGAFAVTLAIGAPAVAVASAADVTATLADTGVVAAPAGTHISRFDIVKAYMLSAPLLT